MTDTRIVQMLGGDGHVITVKPDPSLAVVMGRFTAARYDRDRHVYDLPADQAEQFATFCRVHSITVVDTRPVVRTYRPSPDTERIVAESRARAASAQQPDVNLRGLLLCKVAVRQAALRRGRAR